MSESKLKMTKIKVHAHNKSTLNQALTEELNKAYPSIAEAIRLIEAGADITLTDSFGDGIGHSVGRNGTVEDLEKLISLGLDVNRKGSKGTNMGVVVAVCNSVEMMRVACENGLDINQQSKGLNIANALALTERVDMMDFLLNKEGEKLDLNNKGKDGWTSGHMVARVGKNKMFLSMVMSGRLDLRKKDDEKIDVIHAIIDSGRPEMLRIALRYGLKEDAVNVKNEDGYSIGHAVLFKKSDKMLKVVIEEGYDIYQTLDLKISPYRDSMSFEVVAHGNAKMLSRVLKYLDVNYQNSSGSTIGHMIAYYGMPKMLKAAIKAGLDTNIQNNEGTSTGHHIAAFGTVEMFKMALDAGMDIDAQNHYGTSIGHTIAHRDDNLEMFKIAIDAGMDVNAKDSYGTSIGHMIVLHGTPEMLQIAINSGMDVNAQDDDGKSLLVVCDGKDKEAKIQLIKDHIEKLESQSETGLDR